MNMVLMALVRNAAVLAGGGALLAIAGGLTQQPSASKAEHADVKPIAAGDPADNRNFECGPDPQSRDTGYGKVMIDETGTSGGFSVWKASVPDMNRTFRLDADGNTDKTDMTPGSEMYRFADSEFTGELVHEDPQDTARPNEWHLFVMMKAGARASVYLKCAEHSARPTVAPPSLKDAAKSKDFDCDVEDEGGIYPSSGHAHVHVDADKQQVVTTLVDLNVNGLDHKTVSLTYPLKNYYSGKDGRPDIFWSPSDKDAGTLTPDMNDPSKFLMMTPVPGDWPSWVHVDATSGNYRGIFSCRATS
jgi:hypothetical protein